MPSMKRLGERVAPKRKSDPKTKMPKRKPRERFDLSKLERQPEKYRKLVKDRFKEKEKQIKENYFPKDIRKGNYEKRDKDSLTFFKKARAYDKTGKKGSAIDYLAKKVKEKEESPANVERGMGKGYKKGGRVCKVKPKLAKKGYR